ncbi:MAG: hypothetical protein GY811_20220 [Myxococcales bacterium]|nr:hypothetical protein [Myxococcales bacterium]
MQRERILTTIGYDTALVAELSEKDRSSLRGAAVSWLVACVVLGVAAGYAAHLVLTGTAAPVIGGITVTLLTANLLRVITAGGGSKLGATLAESEEECRRYRPSLIPALVFGVLAVILAQPAQIPFWSELEPQVEQHRQELIEQHNVAAMELGTNADYYRAELEAAGFPIFRLKLIWKDPKRAVRLTFIILFLVLTPAFWSQIFSIDSVRAYELERAKRKHEAVLVLDGEMRQEVSELLGHWPTYARVATSGREST